MVRYVLKRILQSIPIFIGITLIVFIMSNLAPGGPVDILATAGNLNDAQIEALKVTYGLDKPIIVRYGSWLLKLLQGNLGMSNKTGKLVVDIIGQRIGPSLMLSLTSLVFSLSIGIVLGVLSAHKPYSIWDKISSGIAFFGSSMPSFCIALILIYILAVRLKILPASGMYGPGPQDLKNLASHIFLPALVVGLQSVGGYIKQTRGAVLECVNEDYIKTVRSKGISEWRVTIHHCLRNAWVPIITQFGLSVPYIVGGSVVTEQIFGWPGIGSLMVSSISGRDYNVIMGITVLIAVTVLVCNIILDVVYVCLDARIMSEN